METTTTRAIYDLQDFMDEHVTTSKLVARLQGMEYGDKYVVLQRLTPTHEENITVALERKEARQFVMHQKEITARDLADDTQVEISLASTKLAIIFVHRAIQPREELWPTKIQRSTFASIALMSIISPPWSPGPLRHQAT